MSVLSLVTNAPGFYRRETAALADLGVRRSTLAVPGDLGDGRSVADYLGFVPRVLGEAPGEYDLVHANYGLTAPAALAQRRLPGQPRLPVVLSLWGSDLMGQYGWLSKACARYCDEVVVMSGEMADRLGGDPHVIPHGVDVDRFRPAPNAVAREQVGWSGDARHVLFPYAPDRSIKDFPRAGRVVDAARQRLDAPVELHVLGSVAHEAVPTYLNAADALLVTSRREGSPNAVKEALACNLPVVSTDVGDVRERLRGVSPSAVGESDEELAAALADVLADPRRSDGRETVTDLRIERTAARLAGVYERALGREPGVGASGPDGEASRPHGEASRRTEAASEVSQRDESETDARWETDSGNRGGPRSQWTRDTTPGRTREQPRDE